MPILVSYIYTYTINDETSKQAHSVQISTPLNINLFAYAVRAPVQIKAILDLKSFYCI